MAVEMEELRGLSPLEQEKVLDEMSKRPPKPITIDSVVYFIPEPVYKLIEALNKDAIFKRGNGKENDTT